MALNFFFDEADVRTLLTNFAKLSSSKASLLTKHGFHPWTGSLPERAEEYFYQEPWILCSQPALDLRDTDLSVFTDDEITSLEQHVSELAKLDSQVDWAVFPWGGNYRYGMLGQITHDPVPPNYPQIKDTGLFQYPSVQDFRKGYHGVIGRRTESEFAPLLWRAIHGDYADLLIITFKYYEDAFSDSNVEFSVVGTIADSVVAELSVYRISDFSAFRYFVGLINTVTVFEMLPGDLSLQACQEVRQLTTSRSLSAALKHTPWFLVCNEGEIDTYPVLFVSSEHQRVLRFVSETRKALKFASYF